ncbi:MAG: radical SAM protein [Spirochaetaceae bacterium]|jgi:putative pyruvate formate lyase activating enzyme|nr:radical SAM protein [Spirochaetaceae bacterium]
MNPVFSYQSCRLCPRRCGINRISANKPGYCGENAALRLACAVIHRGEEPPLTGTGGSGTIFVSGCNLGCAFCQNWQISGHQNRLGKAVDTALFARICLALQEKGAENINIVTGSHAVPAIAAGIAAAKDAGLHLPVLWNSSGYELPETLELLADTVDVFLPDIKTLDTAIAARYFNAPDYPDIAAAAIKKMIDLRPLRFKERESGPAAGSSRLVSGVMVRHLVLPGHLEASRKVLRWFAALAERNGNALLSLMFQYTPPNTALEAAPKGNYSDAAFPMRYITPAEYNTALGWLSEFGIEDGYCQELIPGADWLPNFERTNPFPQDMAVPVWHWKNGFFRIDDVR